MLEINLLPLREARRKAGARAQLVHVALTLLVAVGGIGLVHTRAKAELEGARTRVAQMQSDVQHFKPQLDRVAAFRKEKQKLEQKIAVIDELDRARSGPVRILSELAARTPDRLWLTHLETKKGSLNMKGKSLDNELVAHFLRALDQSPYFDSVDLDSTKVSDHGSLRLVDFVIRARIHNTPVQKPGATG